MENNRLLTTKSTLSGLCFWCFSFSPVQRECDAEGLLFSPHSAKKTRQKSSVIIRNTDVCTNGPIRLSLFTSRGTYKRFFFKDDVRSHNFVHLGHFSQCGLCLGDSALRKQPSRRLWDKPASFNKGVRHMVCGSGGCYTEQRTGRSGIKATLFFFCRKKH